MIVVQTIDFTTDCKTHHFAAQLPVCKVVHAYNNNVKC